MKYIDTEKLKELLDAKYKEFREKGYREDATYYYFADGLDVAEQLVDSLQQEQSEVDLEKEIDREWEKCNPTDEGMGVETANIHIEAFDMITRHFYELGLNARKEKRK